MDQLVNAIERVNDAVHAFAWGPVMLTLLVVTGVYLTFRTRFVQVRRFGTVIRSTIGSLFRDTKRQNGANLSPFQAVTTALAGTIGTGNIAGVTGAIFTGGPGAVFWMWVSGFFGMCTKYAEIALAVKYRQTDSEGRHHGGPMYYIVGGLGKGWRWLAVIFSVFGVFASFGIGNIAQSSEIAGAAKGLFGVEPWITGVALAVIVAVVVLGGVKRIGTVTSYLVPFMGILYIVSGLILIISRASAVPTALQNIFRCAFNFRAAGGGLLGYGIQQAIQAGIARGVFSNEAGLGSAPIAHAASSTKEPAEQAMWGVFEVFMSTMIICTITAITILVSFSEEDLVGGVARFGDRFGPAAVEAFTKSALGGVGGVLIQISIVFFALSTILGWCYYGEACWGFITHNNKAVLLIYKIVFILVCIPGAAGTGTLMWHISDTLNGLMALPNLVALLPLAGTVSRITKDYFSRLPGKKKRSKT